jgi:hypothetical protein
MPKLDNMIMNERWKIRQSNKSLPLNSKTHISLKSIFSFYQRPVFMPKKLALQQRLDRLTHNVNLMNKTNSTLALNLKIANFAEPKYHLVPNSIN